MKNRTYFKIGSFAQPGSTGNQAITGLGFSPSCVLFWMNDQTSDGSSANVKYSWGAGYSSSKHFYFAFGAQDTNVTAFAGTRAYVDTKCIGVVAHNAATTLAEAAFVSLDADGFTINWTTVDATARIVNYIAFGGVSVFIGTFTMNTTGDKVITGVGFQPDVVLLSTAGVGTSPPVLQASSVARLNMGIMVSASQRGTSAATFNSNDTRSGSDQRSNLLHGGAGVGASPATGTTFDLVTMDSDGFTINSALSAGVQYYMFIAIRGVTAHRASFNQATSTGNQAVTGVGFTPQLVILSSNNAVSGSSGSVPGLLSLGAAMSPASRFAIYTGGSDSAIPPTVASQNLDRANLLKMMTAGGASPTLVTAADHVSMDPDGFTINNTTVDATAREILYLALGAFAIPTMPLSSQAVKRAGYF